MNLIVIALLFFASLVVAIQLGWRYGRRMPQSADFMEGLRGTEAAMFGMLGLLIAFTFYGAASRFEERRKLVIDETNAIGTAYLRLDLLAPQARNHMRELFKAYADKRLEVFNDWLIPAERDARAAESIAIQNQIWAAAIKETQKGAKSVPNVLLLPALNQMFDIAATRMAYIKIHPPKLIYALLVIITLLCGAIAGFSMSKYSRFRWLHVLGFSLIITLTFYVILDVEYPRAGFIRLVEIDQLFRELRQSLEVN